MTDDNQEDVRRVIAICFRGTEAMSDLDLERILSFDMEWLSPDEARLVCQLIDKGWLTGDGDSLAPSFNQGVSPHLLDGFQDHRGYYHPRIMKKQKTFR